MITRRLAQCLLTLTFCLAFSGCASWFSSDERDPAVHLVRVEVVRAKLLEQRFMLHFRIDNPNDSDLTVRGLEYRIHLGDILLAEGEHEHWITVGPNSSRFYKVPIRTNLWPRVKDLVKQLKSPEQAIPYRLEGEMETGLFIAHYVHLARNGVIIPADLIPE
ncbi:LEA type 2 family protein [Pseudomonas sp. SWRI74]|jgi:LEA14-like dessication related protein|uniref:LEA type 2 family protein n=1 Tax=Pseudomonas azerbaijanoccidentalis TaxID=2842347 RepID=A0ABS6QMB7_9PSED|nr:LEA type 2 family protein [Pseudomonas azerbaijanoccidentalis]MBV4519959.1 LEA type 2 family protein [Pseudomonas azerbaijanoccidentalis]MCK8667672.1 LEA type 2 family protein [Pseudomonas azerbaijanoccidentalis]